MGTYYNTPKTTELVSFSMTRLGQSNLKNEEQSNEQEINSN